MDLLLSFSLRREQLKPMGIFLRKKIWKKFFWKKFLEKFFFSKSISPPFLVACSDSIRHHVGPSVGWSVRRSVGNAFVFLAFFGQFSHHCSCPIARDWFCRVYVLALFWACINWVSCFLGVLVKSHHKSDSRVRMIMQPMLKNKKS